MLVLDRDSRAVAEALDDALKDSGLPQTEFARALGTSGSRFSTYRSGKTMPSAAFLLRAQRLSAAYAAANRQGWMTPTTTIAAIRDALDRGDALWALKMTIQARDHVREQLTMHSREADGGHPQASKHTATPLDAWEASCRLGDPAWDTLLSALVAHEFTEHGAPAPQWATTLAPLPQDWVFPNPFMDAAQVRTQTPEWLASLRLFIAARDLSTP